MSGALIVLCLRRFPVFGDLDMTYTTRGLESSRILRLICLGGEHGHTGRREAQTLLYNTGLSAGPSKDRPSYSAMLLNRRFSYNQLSRSRLQPRQRYGIYSKRRARHMIDRVSFRLMLWSMAFEIIYDIDYIAVEIEVSAGLLQVLHGFSLIET